MTDAAQKTKALKCARLMLLQVRGHLLSGLTRPAAQTLHGAVIPFLAVAADDEIAATQAVILALDTLENLSSNPVVDWAALDRAEACLDRGQSLEAIAEVALVLRPPPARIITAIGAGEGPKDLLFFWHHQTGASLSRDEEKVLAPLLTGCLLCEAPLTSVNVFYPTSTPVHMAILNGLGPQPTPDWTPSVGFGLCARHARHEEHAYDLAERAISEQQLKETA